MKCLLLGEGPSDLGRQVEYPEEGIVKGPMTFAIDALAASKGVSNIKYDLLTRGDIKKGLKESKRMISPRPKKIDKEMANFFNSAWYLGTKARQEADDFSVYFHDPDHTRAESERTGILIEQAMLAGFNLSRFDGGIPMVPEPRSEAWLLAYFQEGLPDQREYNKAERFEKLPANDDSPNSAKKLLQKAVNAVSPSDTYAIVMKRIDEIDWARVNMPSYNRFRERLESVLEVLFQETQQPDN